MIKIRLSLVLVLCLGTILAFVLGIGLLSGAFVQEKVVTQTKKVKQISPNNVFLGDSLTDYFDLDAAFADYSVVNSGIAGNTTENVLADLTHRVSIYNPSQVFVWLGTFYDQDHLDQFDSSQFPGRSVHSRTTLQ